MPNKNPLVSVVIPAYNQGEYLGEAIQSALNQTFQDYEIIVVNDGSTDNTSEIISHYQGQIIDIYQENRGLSGARNTAIANARGEFIALLDSDDVWLPEFLEKTVALLSNDPQASMVCSGYSFIDSQGNEIGVPNLKVAPPNLVPSAVIFRKSLATEVGLFDEEIGPVADTALWMRLLSIGSLMCIPEALIKYRRHSSNMSKDPTTMVLALTKYYEKRYGPLDITRDNEVQKIAAYRKLFQSGARRFLAFGDFYRSVKYFIQLNSLDSSSSLSMLVWRSFCRAQIPLEFSNDPNYKIDFEKMESMVLKFLEEIDNQLKRTGNMDSMQRKIRISAYLALAEEGRIAGNFRFFLKYLYTIFLQDPKAMFSRVYWGRVLRYIFGKSRIQSEYA
jgi:glycosyltransferase involved in cell wall biosynthesis